MESFAWLFDTVVLSLFSNVSGILAFIPSGSFGSEYFLAIGIVLLLIGSVFVFFGYRLERVLLRIGFFFIGFFLGTLLFALPWFYIPSQPALYYVLYYLTACGLGVFFAIFEPKLLKLVLFTLIVYTTTVTFAPVIGAMMPSDSSYYGVNLPLFVTIGIGVLLAYLLVNILLPLLLALLAAGIGASLMGSGLVLAFYEYLAPALGEYTNMTVTIFAVVFFLIGVGIQVPTAFRHRRRHG